MKRKIWNYKKVKFIAYIDGLADHNWDDEKVIIHNTNPQLVVDYPLEKNFTFYYTIDDKIID